MRRPHLEDVQVTMLLPRPVAEVIGEFASLATADNDYSVSFESPRCLVFNLADSSVVGQFSVGVLEPMAVMRVGFAEGLQPGSTEATCIGLVSPAMLAGLREIAATGQVDPAPELPNASVPRTADGNLWWDGVNWVPFFTIGNNLGERST